MMNWSDVLHDGDCSYVQRDDVRVDLETLREFLACEDLSDPLNRAVRCLCKAELARANLPMKEK